MRNIRPFLGIPYKHMGRTYSGADCYGLIILFYRDALGIILADINEEYMEDWSFKGHKNYFLENYHKQFEKVTIPRIYDIVLFQNHKGIVNHGGITLGYGKFIHLCKDGTLVDSYNRPGWQKRINGFYRLKTCSKAE